MEKTVGDLADQLSAFILVSPTKGANGERPILTTSNANGLVHEENDGGGQPTDPKLEALALTTSITELGYSLEDVATPIFEIQELRHVSSSAPDSIAEDTGKTSGVDSSLLKLDQRLEATGKEVDALNARIEAYIKSNQDPFLRLKWDETLASWHRTQKEAEDMREELVEDKYLTVYRTVSRQAEDMMQSLEKVFTQCNTFVHEIHTRYGSSVKTNSMTSQQEEELQKELNAFISLHKSLHQKNKYYIPSCEKVLKVIDSGISQQKRSLNGEILRSHADMKSRWRNLQERMTRTEKEMQSVQELLSELSARVTHVGAHKSTNSIDSSSVSTSSRRSSASTPSRSTAPTIRAKVGDWLSPSPTSRKSSDKDNGATRTSPTQNRSMTPFRKITNRLQRSKGNETPPPAAAGSSSNQAGSSRLSSESPVAKRRQGLHENAAIEHTATNMPRNPRTSTTPATMGRQQHRYSQSTAGPSAPSLPFADQRPLQISSAVSERGRSPLPPPARPVSSMALSSASKPAWNASTKPVRNDEQRSLGASTMSRPRKSMPLGTPSLNASGKYAHVTSTYAQDRRQSRNFTTPGGMFRPPSPTFSATSNVSASATRPRPSTPGSRIPAPPSSGGSPEGRSDLKGEAVNTTRRMKGSPRGGEDGGDGLETLFFRSGAAMDEQDSSMMQRAFSPTPSQSALTSASSNAGTVNGRRKSHIPRLSLSASQDIPPLPNAPAEFRKSTYGNSNRSDMMTPEPQLRSRAARVSAMYGGVSASGGPSRSSGRPSLGLPTPASSDFLSGSPRQPRSSATSSTGTRPSSRLSIGGNPGGRRTSYYTPSMSSSLATPLPDMPDGRFLPYYPNKHDPLDVELAEIVNSQPLHVYCRREDPHLTKAAAEAQASTDRTAQYWLARADKPIPCKLVERGTGKPRKVMCRVGGVWQDLSMYLLDQQARY